MAVPIASLPRQVSEADVTATPSCPWISTERLRQCAYMRTHYSFMRNMSITRLTPMHRLYAFGPSLCDCAVCVRKISSKRSGSVFRRAGNRDTEPPCRTTSRETRFAVCWRAKRPVWTGLRRSAVRWASSSISGHRDHTHKVLKREGLPERHSMIWKQGRERSTGSWSMPEAIRFRTISGPCWRCGTRVCKQYPIARTYLRRLDRSPLSNSQLAQKSLVTRRSETCGSAKAGWIVMVWIPPGVSSSGQATNRWNPCCLQLIQSWWTGSDVAESGIACSLSGPRPASW